MTGFPLIPGLACPMRKQAPEDLVMGKTLAAWTMMAAAVAAPAMGPRETVQTAVGRVVSLVQESDAMNSESLAADGRTERRKRGARASACRPASAAWSAWCRKATL